MRDHYGGRALDDWKSDLNDYIGGSTFDDSESAEARSADAFDVDEDNSDEPKVGAAQADVGAIVAPCITDGSFDLGMGAGSFQLPATMQGGVCLQA